MDVRQSTVLCTIFSHPCNQLLQWRPTCVTTMDSMYVLHCANAIHGNTHHALETNLSNHTTSCWLCAPSNLDDSSPCWCALVPATAMNNHLDYWTVCMPVQYTVGLSILPNEHAAARDDALTAAVPAAPPCVAAAGGGTRWLPHGRASGASGAEWRRSSAAVAARPGRAPSAPASGSQHLHGVEQTPACEPVESTTVACPHW